MERVYPLSDHSGPRASSGTDVIVVDDEAVLVEVVREVLGDANIVADACPMGWKAHQCIRTKQPKVVILDVQMPLVDGIQLFHLMRADPKTRDIAVIFFTANAHRVRDQLPNFEELGAELLPKPFDTAKLLALVEKALAA